MKGIYPREKSVQIYFTHNEESYRETLTGMDGEPLPPTPKNLHYAGKVREQILRAIAAGTFELKEFFPHSRTRRGTTLAEKVKGYKVEEAVDLYLSSNKKWAPTTMKVRSAVLRKHLSSQNGKLVSEVAFLDIDQYMTGLLRAKATPGAYNGALTAMRGFFKYCLKAKMISEDPSAEIEWVKADDPVPDPLTPDETDQILSYMKENYPVEVWTYFVVAFRVGLRVSELLGLHWSDIDFYDQSILISRARVYGIEKETKTKKSRVVECDEDVMAALENLHTVSGPDSKGLVFNDPRTHKPWSETRSVSDGYWKPCLKALGIRMRDARQTRHTRATVFLMADISRRYAAEQLGHSEEMFSKTYSKWLPKVNARRELGKVAEFLAAQREKNTP